jgi:hypothetical protein
MKIKNQWVVFNRNQDQLLVETEEGKFFIYTYHSGFLDVSTEEANFLIN